MDVEIRSIREVVTENPASQSWKLLRFFLDVSSVEEQIRNTHNIPVGNHKRDVRKQAQQIHACIRQAEEYFQASSRVGLPTRPLLLYYGAVSLSQALALLRKNGESSLDRLRAQKKHNHHGLELERGPIEQLSLATSVENFFSNLQCWVYKKRSNGASASEQTWGQFSLFYSSLVPDVFHVPIKFYEVGREAHTTSKRVHRSVDIAPIDKVATDVINCWSLLNSLPDLHPVLSQLGAKMALAKGDVEVKVVTEFEKDQYIKNGVDNSNGESRKIKKTSEDHVFYINHIHAEHKSSFLEFYSNANKNIKLIEDRGKTLILRYQLDYTPNDAQPHGYYPDIVEDIFGYKYFVVKPEGSMPEVAKYFVLLYCLGTIARYYPDCWIKSIEHSVQIAEVIDSFLNIVYRKFPNLILDQLTLVKHHLHT